MDLMALMVHLIAIGSNGDHHWWRMVHFKWLHLRHFVAMCLSQSPMKANGINSVISVNGAMKNIGVQGCKWWFIGAIDVNDANGTHDSIFNGSREMKKEHGHLCCQCCQWNYFHHWMTNVPSLYPMDHVIGVNAATVAIGHNWCHKHSLDILTFVIGANSDGLRHWRHLIDHHWHQWIAISTICCFHWRKWRHWRKFQIVMILSSKFSDETVKEKLLNLSIV